MENNQVKHPAALSTESLGPTCVIIPHPDDEALGCGGLLALLRLAGQSVSAVLVSDGSASHPNSKVFSPEARRAVREGELRHALSVLGIDDEPLLLRLPDGAVPAAPGQPGFVEAAARLHEALRQQEPQTLLLPWRRDPHPDHRASYALAQAACAGLPHPPRQLEYLVWAWERAAPADLPQPADKVQELRLDIAAVLPQKLRALAAHRSQIAPGVFTDDAEGFLLPAGMLVRFERPYEIYYAPADRE